MITTIVLALAVTLAIASGTKGLVPNWLIVIVCSVIPAALFVIYRIYRKFVEIGMQEANVGPAPPDVVDNFAASLSSILMLGVVWLLIAVATSLIVVRFWDQQKNR